MPDPAAPTPWSRTTVGPGDAVAAYRSARLRGLSWGVFLLLAALGSYLVGAATPSNDAVPLWSPALALIGLVSLALGWRAHLKLRSSSGRTPRTP